MGGESVNSLDPAQLIDVGPLGQGSFGTVRVMEHKGTGRRYAVKIESVDSRAPQLQYEGRVYTELKHTKRIVKAYAIWIERGAWRLAMELLGPSLEAVRTSLTINDIITWVAVQAIEALRNVHDRDYVHRDVKPDNFLVGPSGIGSRELYLIDFGLAKKYRVKGQHIVYRDKKHLTGTARYASIHTHLGREQSRRDDMESLGYTLVYLMKGSLPWQQSRNRQSNKDRTKDEQYKLISECKQATSIEALCENLPIAMTYYFHAISTLEFDSAPDYEALINFFHLKHI